MARAAARRAGWLPVIRLPIDWRAGGPETNADPAGLARPPPASLSDRRGGRLPRRGDAADQPDAPGIPGAGAGSRPALGDGAGRAPPRPPRPGGRALQVLVPGGDQQRALALPLRDRIRHLPRRHRLGEARPRRDARRGRIAHQYRRPAPGLERAPPLPLARPAGRGARRALRRHPLSERKPAAAGHLPGRLPGRDPLDRRRRTGDPRRRPLLHLPRSRARDVDADDPQGHRRRGPPPAGGLPLGERRSVGSGPSGGTC